MAPIRGLRPATRGLSLLQATFSSRLPLAAAPRFQQRAYVSDPINPDQENRDLEVGELQGAKFRIEPLRRVGESPETMRARLLCTSPSPFHTEGATNINQTSPASAEPSNPTSSSPHSPPPTSQP